MLEVVVFLEKANLGTNPQIENVIRVKSETSSFDKSLNIFFAAFQQSHSPFLSGIMLEENVQLPQSLKEQALAISESLSLSEDVRSEIERLLIKVYVDSDEQIYVSKSAEREFLMYTYKNGTYRNILVDGDGDVEILIIPSDKSRTHSKRFYKEDGMNLSSVLSAFNGM